ncbi:MAG: hypothetical protein IPL34_20335 [Thiofilum sp.]|nr:hypothetical protein [Thiofilum sp.]
MTDYYLKLLQELTVKQESVYHRIHEGYPKCTSQDIMELADVTTALKLLADSLEHATQIERTERVKAGLEHWFTQHN